MRLSSVEDNFGIVVLVILESRTQFDTVVAPGMFELVFAEHRLAADLVAY